MTNTKVGCCGWPVSLKKYRELFKVVEVQKTFYKLPMPETAERWRETVGEDFEFVVKAPQLITHPPTSPTYKKASITVPEEKRNRYGLFRPTDEVFQAYEDTVRIAKILKSKLILFQTPASFKETPENIKNLWDFFSMIDQNDFVMMWEPRGNWQKETLTALLGELNLVHVVDPFKATPLFGGILYFRLHGRGKGYRYIYSEKELRELIDIVDSLKEGKEAVYIMFNNTNMLEDARKFLNEMSNRPPFVSPPKEGE